MIQQKKTTVVSGTLSLGISSQELFHSRIRSPKAFTLVELIVVITILAILGTIGFISLQGYSSKSRDSTRASNLSLAARSLETYQVNASRYPSPDNITGTGQIGTPAVTVAITGVFGENVAPLVKLDKAPKDPQSSNYLAYWVDINNRQYQIAATFESTLAFDVNDRDLYAFGPEVSFEEGVYATARKNESGGYEVVSNNASLSPLSFLEQSTIPTVHGAPPPEEGEGGSPVLGMYQARVAGNYNGIIRVLTGLYNTPSLIFFSGGTFTPYPSPINLADTNTRFITNNGGNIPYIIGDAIQGTATPVQSLRAVGSTASTLTGVIIDDSQWNTQSGSLAAALGYSVDTIGIAAYGVKEYAKVQGGGNVVLTEEGESPTCSDGLQNGTETGVDCGGSCGACVLTDWRTVDTNCTKPDITIGSQTWAGCNSTIGTGVMYTGQTNPTEADPQSNIYGKLYTFIQAPAACTTGYHTPTNAEWDTLMTNLGCSGTEKRTWENGESQSTWWECTKNTSDTTNTWLGWTSTNPNSLRTQLWLTLAGYCYGGSCNSRGDNALYWSSSVYSPSPTSGWSRYLDYANPSVLRSADDQSYAFSVRCLKD